MPNYSVIIPVYGCCTNLNELYLRINKTLGDLNSDYEIIMVNDASPDNAWETITTIHNKDSRVKGINFARNFGQHYAITAGLEHCSGDWIIVMDCDLQDQPEEIIKLIDKSNEGYDVVFGRRKIRMDNAFKRYTSKIFYIIFDYFTENNSDSTVSNFGIYSRQVISNFIQFREHNRLFPLIIKWLGFNVAYVDVEHAKRASGKSSYNYFKLFDLAIDAIISQSNKPLKLSIKFGFIMAFISLAYLVYLAVRKFFLDIPMGWTSVMVSIFFMGGLIFANLGLLGLYIGKIFDETKNRPLYVIKETKGNFNSKKNV